MRRNRLFVFLAAFSLAMPLTIRAQAFPIAPVGTEGLSILVGSSNPIIATYLGNSATFSNNLFLMLDGAGNPGDDGNLANDLFIFNNQTSAVGSMRTLGSFTVGTELIFRLFVSNTSINYYTGPAVRNPDGRAHARAQSEFTPGTTLVSFEDLFNTPEGANGFNDLSFSFTNTVAPPINVVPEPSTFALLAAGLGLACIARRRVLRRTEQDA